MSSVIEGIQSQIAAQLGATAYFASIPIVTEHIGDLANQYAKAMGVQTPDTGKVGAIIIVISPDANANWGNVPGPFFDEIKFSVQVSVNPSLANGLNGIGLTALDICENICQALHQFYPTLSNGPIVPEKPTIQLFDRDNDSGTVTYLVNFKTMGGVRTVPPKIATPVIANTGTYTLTCSTAGAAIFYTTDSTNPGPTNGTFYTGAFSVGTGLTLKARAFLAGYLTSDIASTST